jgi:hypothetical protein
MDGLEAEYLHRLGYLIAAFDGFSVVGVCNRPIIPNMVVGDSFGLKCQFINVMCVVSCVFWFLDRAANQQQSQNQQPDQFLHISSPFVILSPLIIAYG